MRWLVERLGFEAVSGRRGRGEVGLEVAACRGLRLFELRFEGGQAGSAFELAEVEDMPASAASMALASAAGRTIVARSISVRIGVVTGMPRCVVLSGLVVACETTPSGGHGRDRADLDGVRRPSDAAGVPQPRRARPARTAVRGCVSTLPRRPPRSPGRGLRARTIVARSVSCPHRSGHRDAPVGGLVGSRRGVPDDTLGRLARPPRVVVTWMPPAGLGRISHSAAAVVWLSIAFGPQARTAASQWPSVRSTLCPSAYTPLKG